MGLHWLIIVLNASHVYYILIIVRIVIIHPHARHVYRIIIYILIRHVKSVNKDVNHVILLEIVKYVSDNMYYKLIIHANYVNKKLLDVNNVCIIQVLSVLIVLMDSI
jgi:hypothetical protein